MTKIISSTTWWTPPYPWFWRPPWSICNQFPVKIMSK